MNTDKNRTAEARRDAMYERIGMVLGYLIIGAIVFGGALSCGLLWRAFLWGAGL